MKTWLEALEGMPSIEADRWHGLDLMTRWLVATRAAVLTMTLLSCAIAGLFAWRFGGFDAIRFGLLCIGLTLAHATNNILNDVSDHRRGVDRDNAFRTRYGTQPVEEGLMSVSQAHRWAFWTALPALGCGVALCVMMGADIVPFFAIGVLLVFGYNWPLKHYGLGEPIVVLVWGPLMVGGGYLSITGDWSWSVAAASIPYALGPTTVLFGKHIDKIPWDEPRKVRTLPVLLGHSLARRVTLGLLGAQYGITLVLVGSDVLHWPLLLVFLAAPFLRELVPIYQEKPPAEPPPDYPKGVWPLWYSAYAFVHFRRFGLLFVLGLGAQVCSARFLA